MDTERRSITLDRYNLWYDHSFELIAIYMAYQRLHFDIKNFSSVLYYVMYFHAILYLGNIP